MKTSNTTFCYPSKVIVFLLLSSSLCLNGQWAWMGGSQSTGNLGNYGTKGVPSINNMPRARYEAAQWTDKNGNFWLWGGQVISSPSSYLSDMWRYNPSTGEWTWMSGSSGANATAVFGTQGVPSVNNTPPASHCEATWVDTSGNFWLFGGDQYNDLWRYNPLTSEWTWMKGTQTGVSGNWGQKEVPATANIPPKTSEGCATWITLDNSLWFYGGSSWPNLWGTLWRYNVASNRWTWMSGSDMPNTPAVYGTKGVAHPFNTPGGRQTFASWKDNLERFWLYGGSIFDGSAGLNKNDLWMYDPESNMWTWMEGDTGTGYPGNFINKCEEGEIRGGNENKTGWVDRKGNLWTWGGGDYLPLFRDTNNALWMYDMLSGEWIWVSGNDQTSFGTLGVPSPANSPPARAGACGWLSADGSYWIFGGGASSGGSRNDLWRYVIDSACVYQNSCNLPLVILTASKVAFCAGDSAQVCAPSGYASYHWSNNQSDSCIQVKEAGDYFVTVTDNSGCTAESNVAITVYPLPDVLISVRTNANGYTLSVQPRGVTRQWFKNGNAITGATDTTYFTQHLGSYTVTVTDSNGCTATSNPMAITDVDDVSANDWVNVFPNPSHNSWQLTVVNNFIGGTAEVFDANGSLVFQTAITHPQSAIAPEIPKGIYLLRISSSKSTVVRKLVRL